jgi:hypothetical protein
LNSLNAGLYERYRAAAAQQSVPAGIEEALSANERKLAEFCSKDVYAAQYPGFARIFAEAESMDYSPPQRSISRMQSYPVTTANDVRAGRNGTSMLTDPSATPYPVMATESLAVPAASGAVDGGGAAGAADPGGSMAPVVQ